MKTLNAFAIVDKATNLKSFKKTIAGIHNLEVRFETNIESAIDLLNQQTFDLLIIDKALPLEDYNKLHKLADLLHPDAALVAFVMTDDEFISYKMAGLMAKWMDAQSGGKTNFIDNPTL